MMEKDATDHILKKIDILTQKALLCIEHDDFPGVRLCLYERRKLLEGNGSGMSPYLCRRLEEKIIRKDTLLRSYLEKKKELVLKEISRLEHRRKALLRYTGEPRENPRCIDGAF